MRTIAVLGSLVTLCGLAPGCTGDPREARAAEDHGDDAPGRHAAARRSLLAADGLLAAAVASFGEADGLWPWLADDAIYLHPGVDLITGRGAARAFLRQAFPERDAWRQGLHRVTGDVSGDARLGYTVGWFDEVAPGGAAATRYGRYLATWQRTAGPWQVVGFVRIPGTRAPSPPPPDAGILAGEHGVVQPGDPGALRAQALAADAAFSALSVAQGYTIAFTTYGASDALIVGGADLFWNAAGVAAVWAGWTPGATLAWSPLAGRAAASGDLAYTIGTARFTRPRGPTGETSYTKYLTVWIHQADGRWRFLLDGGNPRPAPPP